MINSMEVLDYLRPEGGMIQTGTDYEGIEFIWAKPFTKKEYDDAFEIVKNLKIKTEADKAAAKASAQAKLAALGLTADEVAAIIGA